MNDHSSRNGPANQLDLSNRQFERLTAERPTDKRAKDGSVIWECRCSCGKTIFVASYRLLSGRKKSCGCLIVDTQRKRIKGMTEKNLKEGTSIGSIKNVKPYSSNSSGVRGVYWYKPRQKWMARISFQCKTYFLGYFDDLLEAEKVRKLAEEKIYGDFLAWYNEQHKPSNK